MTSKGWNLTVLLIVFFHLQLNQNVKNINQNLNRIMLTLKDTSVITLDKMPPTLLQKTKEYLEKLKQGKTSMYPSFRDYRHKRAAESLRMCMGILTGVDICTGHSSSVPAGGSQDSPARCLTLSQFKWNWRALKWWKKSVNNNNVEAFVFANSFQSLLLFVVSSYLFFLLAAT